MSTSALITGNLNKHSLAEALAAELGVSHAKADAMIDAFANIVTRTVTSGHEVALTNFGTFRPVEVDEHAARNPQTGQMVTVPARTTIRFRPSQRLKDIVAAGDPTASRRKRSRFATREGTDR